MEIQFGLKNPNNAQFQDLGTVVDGDHLIDLTQNAYVTQGGDPAECWYEAHAESRSRKDDCGNPIIYKVRWEITNPDAEDEEDACDWDEFTIEEL